MEEKEDIGRKSIVMMLTSYGDLEPVTGGEVAEEAELVEEAIPVLAPGEETDPAATTRPSEDKYEIVGTVGSGGMGDVFLVHDHDLKRQVAMKVLKEEIAKDPQQKLGFVAEAQATSQLEHPGIPPVHDIGVTPSGKVYFTMKLVRGRTLQKILKDLRKGVEGTDGEYTLHRLASILERVCEALHFAHERGVIHRDLKPENLMLGAYGEVHVMDWGIAKIAGETEEEVEGGLASQDTIQTAGTESGVVTMDGMLKGTIPYMSPEQANGIPDQITHLSDVYALGVILYEMLSLRPAFKFEGFATLLKVIEGDVVPVAERNPDRPVPQPLADLCARAMAKDAADRPQTAAAFGAELRAWLDGSSEAERRHEEAEAFAAKGREAAERFEAIQREIEEAREAAEEIAGQFKPWQPVEEKAPLIEARERVSRLEKDFALAFAETLKLLGAALLQEERNASARSALANLWARRLEMAELENDEVDAAYALEMIRRYDDGDLAGLIKGDGSLVLESDPPGAEVGLIRFEQKGGLLRESEEKAIGTTPLEVRDLPMGSYLAILRKEGVPDIRYPFHISRNREWRGEVKLRSAEEIGDGFVYVPGGPFLFGEARGARVEDIPDFAISKYPVTLEEYSEFLRALPEDEAEKRKPMTPGDGPYMERGEDGEYHTLPVIVEGKARERCEGEYGFGFELQIPAVGLSFEDVTAYCEWKTKTTGVEHRLPTEQEREKAARGVDGRRFPWGDLEDSTLAKCRESLPEPAQPEPVGAFPTATSVYGMGDASGGVWDWTDSWFDDRKNVKVLKGGSWSLAVSTARCAARYRGVPRFRDTNIGFRCARSL